MKRAARLVLIDRDGVINRDSAEYIRSVEEWEPLPGSLGAIADLTRAGFTVAVVTNQSGIGRGLLTEQTLAAIHAAMQQAVEAAGGRIAGIYHCPHLPDDGCECRKPRPGLLHQAAEALGLPLAAAPFIGDKASDAEAARAAGARPILVGTTHHDPLAGGVEHYADLAAAARQLIGEAED